MEIQKNIKQCEMCKDEEATLSVMIAIIIFVMLVLNMFMIEKRIVGIKKKKLIYLFL